MGLVDSFRNFLGMAPRDYDEDYYEDDRDYDDYDDEPEQVKTKTSSRRTKTSSYDGEKVVPINGRAAETRIKVIKPANSDAATTIADEIKARRMVIINIAELAMSDEKQAQTIIDFISGAAYAVDGDVKKISDYIFVATPRNIDVDGESVNVRRNTKKKNWDKY